MRLRLWPTFFHFSDNLTTERSGTGRFLTAL